MTRCLALLLLFAASHSGAQVVGVVKNVAAVPMVLEWSSPNGWTPLAQPDGLLAFAYPGECWEIAQSARAGQYRGEGMVLVNNIYAGQGCFTQSGAPACPYVDDATLPAGQVCSRTVIAVDPRDGAYRGPMAPTLLP
jgi:hypothetical protein